MGGRCHSHVHVQKIRSSTTRPRSASIAERQRLGQERDMRAHERLEADTLDAIKRERRRRA